MPEGPEVKSMVNKLETFINSTLKEIKIISGRYIHHGNPKNFDYLKLPLKIIDIKTHGKFTIINLNHTIYIYIVKTLPINFILNIVIIIMYWIYFQFRKIQILLIGLHYNKTPIQKDYIV